MGAPGVPPGARLGARAEGRDVLLQTRNAVPWSRRVSRPTRSSPSSSGLKLKILNLRSFYLKLEHDWLCLAMCRESQSAKSVDMKRDREPEGGREGVCHRAAGAGGADQYAQSSGSLSAVSAAIDAALGADAKADSGGLSDSEVLDLSVKFHNPGYANVPRFSFRDFLAQSVAKKDLASVLQNRRRRRRSTPTRPPRPSTTRPATRSSRRASPC